jgi:hypothetical protein
MDNIFTFIIIIIINNYMVLIEWADIEVANGGALQFYYFIAWCCW